MTASRMIPLHRTWTDPTRIPDQQRHRLQRLPQRGPWRYAGVGGIDPDEVIPVESGEILPKFQETIKVASEQASARIAETSSSIEDLSHTIDTSGKILAAALVGLALGAITAAWLSRRNAATVVVVEDKQQVRKLLTG